jgi:hypothetical protein
LVLFAYLVCFLTLTMDAAFFSEMSLKFYYDTRRHIPPQKSALEFVFVIYAIALPEFSDEGNIWTLLHQTDSSVVTSAAHQNADIVLNYYVLWAFRARKTG